MNTFYRFGAFTLDPHRRTLRRGDDEIDLPESARLVLEALVKRAPDTVDKETLMDAAWPDTAVVQDNLVQAVHTIRSALGGDARNPRFVQTVHRRGYRFVAPVELVHADHELPGTTDEAAPSEPRRRWPRRRLIGFSLVLAVVVVAAAAVVVAVASHRRSEHPTAVRTVAVLPLENLSGDPEQEYFADGMTDALITELARIESLDVISRTSVMKFKDTRLSVPQIAAELGVDAVVEGTVTRAGGRIRVIAQLVDARDRHIWGENYEVENRDVLRLQRDFAVAIAEEIGAQVDPRRTEKPPRVVDPEAHEAVLRGHHLLRDRTEETVLRAQAYFNEAVAIDPDYAPAFAGLAYSYNLLANYGFAPSPQARPLAREMAERAIELDPTNADAHLALALVAGEYDWSFDEAEREFVFALKQQPSSPVARSGHSHLLVTMNDLEGAVEELRYAQHLDPLSEIISANIGWILFLDDKEEEAELQLREVLDFSPDFAVAHYYLGALLDRQERFEDSVAVLERARDLSPGSTYIEAALAHVLARSGDRGAAEVILNALLEKSRDHYVSPIGLAVAHFGLGQVDAAFARLEQAFDERKGWLLHLRVEPALDGFRDDPRYLDLVARIGLPEVGGPVSNTPETM